MTKALILVDLQNDFLPGGALAVPRGDEVVPLANRLQPFFPLVVATQDWHPPDHLSFAAQYPTKKIGDTTELRGLPQVLWPTHCVQHQPGADFASGLHRNSVARVFQKGADREWDSYSGFFDNGGVHATGLGDYLKRLHITDNYILGLATDYCVMATALDSVRLGFRTWLIEDACRGVELRAGDCAAAIAKMEAAGVQRVTSDRWLADHRDRVAHADQQVVGSGKFIRLMKSGRWEYAQRCNASAVVVIPAITAHDEFVFIEQYREPVGKRCIEFPAGLVGDTPGGEDEDLADAVQRELIEETGFEAQTIELLASGSSSAGLTNEVTSFYLAKGLHRISEGGGIDGELIQQHLVPRSHVNDWLAQRRAEGLDVAMSVYAALWLAAR